MNFKPFKPPSLKNTDNVIATKRRLESDPPFKRRKLSPEDEDDACLRNIVGGASQNRTQQNQERPPLMVLPNPPSPTKANDTGTAGRRFFSIVWRKVTTKKNKTWEDDGALVYRNGVITAFNSKGQKLGGSARDTELAEGDMLVMSGKDLQIEAEISHEEYARIVGKAVNDSKDHDNLTTWNGQPAATNSHHKPAHKMSLQEQMRQQIQQKQTQKTTAAQKVATLPQARNAAFRLPLKDSQVPAQVPSECPVPRHDPAGPNALVFRRPKKAPPGKQIVDIVLDPILTKALRPHQREGVQFLYECVMDLRGYGGQGCILADEMGLGKTLQTIALIWTLLKQNPVYKDSPVIKKVLIVCPVTLIQNWKKEFRKWLGRDRIGVLSLDNEGTRLSMFDGRNFQVMIVGYERLLKIVDDLNKGAGIDLVICDEGHRLKTLQNKSAKAIETLNTPRRIILSGTPIQNDLSEFFAMVNFVNDGVLGTPKAFLKDFERPILKSRQPNATELDIERGREASEELAQTTSPFILRRTAEILSGHLPLKTEYILFCRPTQEQANLYREVLQTPMFKPAMGGTSTEGALQMITILKKLCNSPSLIRPKHGTDEASPATSLQTLNEMLPTGLAKCMHNAYATKIRLLDELLQQIRQNTDDKIVLVSNYTSTLDLIQNVLTHSGMTFRRLDGTVSAKKRQALVDEFNRASQSACFAFLLSAKAGGVGINLIGANRLILFDIDWNPAIENQAMARIHRDGQSKPCYIYRLLIKGSIEERIWQRQVVKCGLANSIMDSGAAVDGSGKKIKGQAQFSAEELRDLFTLDENNALRTHELIECDCWLKRDNSIANIIGDVDDVDELGTEDDEEYDQPIRTFSFVPASQVSKREIEEQEKSVKRGVSPTKSRKNVHRQEQMELQELMTYTHVDASSIPDLSKEDLQQLHDSVDDPCLISTLSKSQRELPGNIAYIFLKKSRVQNLDETTELDCCDEEPLECDSGAAVNVRNEAAQQRSVAGDTAT